MAASRAMSRWPPWTTATPSAVTVFDSWADAGDTSRSREARRIMMRDGRNMEASFAD
jgi:hypothetical protein